jgi:hypothetical protein
MEPSMTDQTQPVQEARIFAAILEVKNALAREGVGKNQTNSQQQYKFRGIDDIMNAMAAPLVNAGIIVVPRVISRTQDVFVTENKKRVTSVALDVEFIFVAKDGSQITARIQSEASDYADKATNKAISFAMKYAFISVFNIPVVGADDGDFESPGNDADERAPVAHKPQPVAAAPQKAPVKAKPKGKTADAAIKEGTEKAANAIIAILERLNPDVANKVDALIRKAYNVTAVEDIPTGKVGEAVERIESYLKKAQTAAPVKSRPAPVQPDTADDIPE